MAGAGVAGTGVGDGPAGCDSDSAGVVFGRSVVPPAGSVVDGRPEPGFAGASGLLVSPRLATRASAIDVEMKIAAKITVVRVSAFAAPRPVIRPPTPPPVPRPKPPPSERCKRMTPIMAMQTRMWMVRRTAIMVAAFVSFSGPESGGL